LSTGVPGTTGSFTGGGAASTTGGAGLDGAEASSAPLESLPPDEDGDPDEPELGGVS
jgi:hypothetical protein